MRFSFTYENEQVPACGGGLVRARQVVCVTLGVHEVGRQDRSQPQTNETYNTIQRSRAKHSGCLTRYAIIAA